MTAADVKEWLGLIALICSVGTLLWGYISSPSRKLATEVGDKFKSLDTKVSGLNSSQVDHERRIQNVENELKHLPDKDSVVEMKIAMADLRGTVAVLNESVGRVVRTVDRIENYMHGDKK